MTDWKWELDYRAATQMLKEAQDLLRRVHPLVRYHLISFVEDVQFRAEREITEQRNRSAEHERPLPERIEKFRTQHNKLGYTRIAALITDYREENSAPLSGNVRGRPRKKGSPEDAGPEFNTGQLWRVRRNTAGPEACKTVDGFLRHCERHPEWLKEKLGDRGWSEDSWCKDLDTVAGAYAQHAKNEKY
jgi:hypothetical protein